MLTDYLEPFCRMVRTDAADAVGGTASAWQPGESFLGGVTDAAGREQAPGGLAALYTQPVLVHLPQVCLHLHDVVRRERDGMLYRVLGESDDQRTPPCAALDYACVPVEKAVTAP